MHHKEADKDALNAAITRLTDENAQHRCNIEDAQAVIRRRAPAADGLSFKAAIETILNERDSNAARIQDFRAELKKALTLLLEDRVDEAKVQINLFLFNNPR